LSEAVHAQGRISASGDGHVLRDQGGDDLYVLRSENEDLGRYDGEQVTVTGSLEQGPEAGTPVLIVTEVEKGDAEKRSF
jgi:hypothetical protein